MVEVFLKQLIGVCQGVKSAWKNDYFAGFSNDSTLNQGLAIVVLYSGFGFLVSENSSKKFSASSRVCNLA